ncbi:sugar transferase [Patescibacteria group bacterium]|nr:MAG: sugar transferase [Patescibacteria group bacterium]
MYRVKQLTLLAGDLACLYIGLYFAIFLRYLSFPGEQLLILLRPMTFLFLLAAVINFIVGLYDLFKIKNSKGYFIQIAIAGAIWLFAGFIYFYFASYRNLVTPKTILGLNFALGVGLMYLWRYLYNQFVSVKFLAQKVIFMGYTPEVQELIDIFNKEPQRGFRTIQKQSNERADIIVLAPGLEKNNELLKELYDSLFAQTSVMELADFYAAVFGRIPPFTFSESWFISHLQEQQKKIWDRFRILVDYLAAFVIGAIFIISFPLVALGVKLSSPGPIFFKQKRVGRLGGEFTVYKYRTMKALSADGSAETEGPRFAATDDPRVTGVGKILRKTRLDEVPQFINILKGEMSVIGPRPERPEFVAQLTGQMPYYNLRHLIKPGMTGWAQLRRDYYGTLEENLRKLEYDLYYIKNRGPLLDLAILLRTINVVIRLKGR